MLQPAVFPQFSTAGSAMVCLFLRSEVLVFERVVSADAAVMQSLQLQVTSMQWTQNYCLHLYASAAYMQKRVSAEVSLLTEGSVMLVQLFLQSAKDFNDDQYGSAKSSGLRQWKHNFKSWVPDDYQLVRAMFLSTLKHMKHASIG